MTMAKTGIVNFLREVRTEMKKVTWPSRQETVVSTISVFVMVLIVAVFLYFSDQVIAYLVRMILGFGG